MTLVWIGFHEEGRLALPQLLSQGFEFAAIITLTESEQNKRSGVYDWTDLAKQYDIPLYPVEHINAPSSIELLKRLKPDVLVVIGWSQILSADALGCATKMTIGAHASLLPHNRGSAPINWGLIKGETQGGNTLIELSEGVDAGRILAQQSFDISLFDSCKTLYDKVAQTNADMLSLVLSRMQQSQFEPLTQPQTNEPLLPRRRPRDGLINWALPAKQLYDFIRALTQPYPGAYTYLAGVKLIIWQVSWSPESIATGDAGTIAGVSYSFNDSQCGIDINCLEGLLRVHAVEFDGEEVLSGQALVERFENIGAFDE